MLNQEYKIRLATVADLPVLMHMAVKYLREVECKELSEQEYKNVQTSVLQGLVTHSVIILVAECEKKHRQREMGYAVFDLRRDIFFNLIGWGHHLYVEPDYRGSDVALNMVKLAEALAQSMGAVEAYIDTSRPAVFKRKLGYTDKYVVVSKDLREVK